MIQLQQPTLTDSSTDLRNKIINNNNQLLRVLDTHEKTLRSVQNQRKDIEGTITALRQENADLAKSVRYLKGQLKKLLTK
ncbi:MAG: hypothetical protein GY941_22105 [Planctomycetes bacterium]|nr:hypothetical protein [Planctomycetota bacterium]